MKNVTEISEVEMRAFIARAHIERSKAFSNVIASFSSAVKTVLNALAKHGETSKPGNVAGAH